MAETCSCALVLVNIPPIIESCLTIYKYTITFLLFDNKTGMTHLKKNTSTDFSSWETGYFEY